MTTVAATVAEQLKADALYVTAQPDTAARWGTRAVNSEVISPFWNAADAQAEADRQAAFQAGPLVRDTVLVRGACRDLLGRAITVRGEGLGYDAAPTVFVVGIDETRVEGCTALSVVRRLT